MDKSKSFLPIFIPSATVFISSFCIMVLELVAARLIARHLGSSLYTWTSVIGVVLAGIAIGNYIGGRIADRFQAQKALAILFAASSAACVVTVILNNLVGEWMWLWYLSWPVRTFTHVSLVFLLPSLLLGTISPVVAKMALDRGLATGRTVGDIYACGAAGSIAGTFAAGYYLIAVMGTIAIIWTVGVVLLVISILYWARFWVLYLWAIIFIITGAIATVPTAWAQNTSVTFGLRQKPDPKVIYEDESQYCYIAVRQISKKPDKRLFMQDKLKHSEIIMGDIDNLQYFHTVVFAAITHGLAEDRQKLSVFHIGGGGYVFPQYVEKNWPGSRNDVAEIDPRVTKAAVQAFGLNPQAPIKTMAMDARVYVDQILKNERAGGEKIRYDFIYEDAFSDYSVPYQLVTKEFNDKIFEILTDEGVYLINSIDIYDSARFIGAYVNTLEKTFPYVYAIAQEGPRSNRKIFVIIASKRELEPDKLTNQYRKDLEFWYLSNSDIEEIKQKAGNTLLTDNYVPVENMLAPVVRQSAVDFLGNKIRDQAQELERNNNLEQAIAKYEELLKLDPTMSVLCYNKIAVIRVRQNKPGEAVEAFQAAIDYNQQTEPKINIANVYMNLGVVLKQLNQPDKASEHFAKAVEGYRELLTKDPHLLKAWVQLGDTLASMEDFQQASECFRKAVTLNPAIVGNHIKLVQSLEIQGKYDEAIIAMKKAINFVSQHGLQDSAAKLQKYLDFIEFKKSKGK